MVGHRSSLLNTTVKGFLELVCVYQSRHEIKRIAHFIGLFIYVPLMIYTQWCTLPVLIITWHLIRSSDAVYSLDSNYMYS